MPYDPGLEARLDPIVEVWPDHEKKAMFGGIGYLLAGNMAIGIWHDSLVVRCGPERWAECLARPHAGEFDITGRSMRGWILVAPEGFEDDDELEEWLAIGRSYASTLPAK